jgi:hypothetical protein
MTVKLYVHKYLRCLFLCGPRVRKHCQMFFELVSSLENRSKFRLRRYSDFADNDECWELIDEWQDDDFLCRGTKGEL